MRSRGLWLLLLALAGGGVLLFLITTRDPDSGPRGATPLADGDEGAEHGAALEGADADSRGSPIVSPFEGETDWRTLLAAVGPTHPVGALDRLVALCKTDPALVRRLVELLHPRHKQLSAPGRSALTNQATSAVLLPGDPPVSVWRAYIIDVLALVGEPAVPALVEAIADASEAYRELVAGVLARIGPDAEGAGDALMGRIQEVTLDPRHRAVLLRTLAAIGTAPTDFHEYLHGLLRADDTQEDLESAAAAALVRLGQVDARAIETLSMVLRGEFLHVRSQVISDIPELGEAAVPLIDDLIGMLDREQDEELHSLVIDALAKLGKADPRVIERLRAELTDPEVHWNTRWADASALARMGVPGRRALLDAQARNPEHVKAAVVLRSLHGANVPTDELWAVARSYLQVDSTSDAALELQYEALAVLHGRALLPEAWLLLEPLLTSRNEELAVEAFASLYYLEEIPDRARALIEADRAQPEPKVFAGGVILANVRAPWLIDLLLREVRHEDESRRASGMGILTRTSDAQLARALPLFTHALRDTSQVRQSAISALEQIGRRPVATKRVYSILLRYTRELEAEPPEAGTPDAWVLNYARSVLWRLRQLGGDA